MNGAVVCVAACNREHSAETASCTDVSAIKTVVITRNSMRHIIVVIPFHCSSGRNRNGGWRETHIHYANCVG